MDGQEGFLHAFGICKSHLKIVGLWPTSKSSSHRIASLVHFTMTMSIIILFVNIAQTMKLIMVWGDLDIMTDVISVGDLPIAVATFKMLLFISHRKEFLPLLSFVKEDWERKKSIETIEKMQENAITARKMSLLCAFLGQSSVQGFLTIRISQELKFLPSTFGYRQLFVNSYVPYDHEPSPIYELTFFFQYLGVFFATVAFTGMYCLFIGMMLHLSAQFSILKEEIIGAPYFKNNFRKKLGVIVERHELLNRFGKGIEKIFNMMFLAEILSCTLQFCLQGFLLVTMKSDGDTSFQIMNILFIVVYFLHIGTHLLISCYVSDKLQEESLSIFQAAYDCAWYDLPPSDAISLIIIMNRSKIPLQITAGKFFVFSMSLYAQILKTSGGYLSMLLAVKDRVTS